MQRLALSCPHHLCLPLAFGSGAAETHPTPPGLQYSSVSATSASVYTKGLPSLQKICAIPLPRSAQLKSHWDSQKLLPSRPEERPGDTVIPKKGLWSIKTEQEKIISVHNKARSCYLTRLVFQQGCTKHPGNRAALRRARPS